MNALRHAGSAVLVIAAIVLAGMMRPALAAVQASHPAKPASASCQTSTFRIVIDVGHTVAVPGAISARGVPEYSFNLRLAEDIRQALADAGFDQTILLITAKPPPLGLVERAVRANRLPANLFIAIHHDSVPANLLQNWEYEGRKHHFNDSFSGYALFISNANVDRSGSLLFAHDLGEALQARGLQYTSHYTLPLMGHHRRQLVDAEAGVYRYDQLVVLFATRMPAVLLEAGSIVNRQEELQLASPERRALTSGAVVAAVEDFCAARSRRGGAQARKHTPLRTSGRLH